VIWLTPAGPSLCGSIAVVTLCRHATAEGGCAAQPGAAQQRRPEGNDEDDPDGHITTVGSSQLTGGYGYWGSPGPVTNGPLAGARLVTTTGTVLATATFPA